MRTADVVAVGASLALTACPLLWAQHADHSAKRLPVVIDGRTSPEKIPDELAFAHFLLALADPSVAASQRSSRRFVLLTPLDLSAQDRGAFMDALDGVATQLDFLGRETQRLSATPEAAEGRLDDLRVRRTNVLSSAQLQIRTKLSPLGREHLDRYLKEQVKASVIVYGDPLQP